MKAGGKRLLRWLLILCGVAVLGPLAHFCWCSTLGSVALLCAVPSALAGLLLWLGKRLLGRGRRWGMALVTIAVAVFVAVLALLANVAWQAGPWHDGIVTHRTAPDGREYVLSQAWSDWYGGYDTRLFVREADGEWQSCWRVRTWKPMFGSGCEIRLPEPDEGKPDVRLANGTDWWFSPAAPTVHPAETTPEELHAFHRQGMANLRAGKPYCGGEWKTSPEATQGGAP